MALIGCAAAVSFWTWIGWDLQATTKPTGGQSGPLEPWQVQGCVITLLVIGVVSGLARRGEELIVAMTAAVPTSWTVWSVASVGGTGGGLVGVGAMMVFVGTFLVTCVVALLTDWRLARSMLQTLTRS